MSDSDQFDRALEKLDQGRSPRGEAAGLAPEEQQMLRLAQRLRGTRGGQPEDEFAQGLHLRLFGQAPAVSRRTAFLAGLGTLAAGILGGLGLDRLLRQTSEGPQVPRKLIPKNSSWHVVAAVAEVPPGAVRPFTAGAIPGFLVNHNGNLKALSRVCTHMGCTLRFSAWEQNLICPCHGAEFDLQGHSRSGPKGYNHKLPPLPQLELRVRGESVEVKSV